MNLFSNYTTIQGVVWYDRAKKPWLKVLIGIITMFIIIGLPIYVIAQFVDFINNDTEVRTVQWLYDENMLYPNITVCNPRYFSQQKMKGKYFFLMMSLEGTKHTLKFL